MGSGLVTAKAVMSAGVEAITGSGLSWRVLGAPDAEGKRPQHAFSYDAQPRFTLPAGAYTVTVKRGSATACQDVEIAPGKTIEATLNFNAAILKATAILAEGSEPHTGSGLSWSVLGQPNAEGKRPRSPTRTTPNRTFHCQSAATCSPSNAATPPPGRTSR